MDRKQESYWTIAEVGACLRVPVETLYTWRKRNYGPPAARIGRNAEGPAPHH